MLALSALTFATYDAFASRQLCRQIEAQLVTLARPAGGQAKRYDKAIRTQELELGKMRTRAANSGCDGVFGGLRGQCGALKSTISRMEANLASLRQQRSGAAGDPRQERARLLAALDANRCRAVAREAVVRQLPAKPEQKPALANQMLGGEIRRTQDVGTRPSGSAPGTVAASGSYRTLCVRTCDGYFFPIAYSSSPANFERDARACEAACPGTEVELFRHRASREEAEQAVSTRTGRPYTELSNAFLYRKAGYTRPATCGCNPPRGFSIVAGGNYTPRKPAIAEAALRAAEAADAVAHADAATAGEEAAAGPVQTVASETVATEAVPPPVENTSITSSVEDAKPAERRIRVVGPTFLPDPEGAIDLRVRDLREAR